MGILGAFKQAIQARYSNEVAKRAFPVAQKYAEKVGIKNEFSRAYSEYAARKYNARQAGLKAAQKREDLLERYRQGGYLALNRKEAKTIERQQLAQVSRAQSRRERVLYTIRPHESNYESNYARSEAETQARAKARILGPQYAGYSLRQYQTQGDVLGREIEARQRIKQRFTGGGIL